MKRLFPIYAILIAAISILFILSCKKASLPADLTTPVMSFSQKAYDYVLMNQGTYFIYRDSVTGTLDSVVVSNCILLRQYHAATANNGPYFADYFNLTLTQYDSAGSSQWFYGSADASNYPPYVTTNDALMVINELDVSYSFVWPFQSPNMGQLISSMTVEGNTYSDVLVFTAANSLAPGPDSKIKVNYWAKGVGIIKREIGQTAGGKLSHSYTLVRHN